jgi:hypothetical protein
MYEVKLMVLLPDFGTQCRPIHTLPFSTSESNGSFSPHMMSRLSTLSSYVETTKNAPRARADWSSDSIPYSWVPSWLVQVDVVFAIFCHLLTQMTGNEPPWTLPAKAKYLEFDRKRASRYFGAPLPNFPSFFPILSMLVSQKFRTPEYA